MAFPKRGNSADQFVPENPYNGDDGPLLSSCWHGAWGSRPLHILSWRGRNVSFLVHLNVVVKIY